MAGYTRARVGEKRKKENEYNKERNSGALAAARNKDRTDDWLESEREGEKGAEKRIRNKVSSLRNDTSGLYSIGAHTAVLTKVSYSEGGTYIALSSLPFSPILPARPFSLSLYSTLIAIHRQAT